MKNIICIHCGSSHVKGNARKYPYYIASSFSAKIRKKDGKLIFYNNGLICGPFRSYIKCYNIAKTYALKNNIQFNETYGSLHNKEIE